MTPPLAQSLAALEQANRVRSIRALVKRDLAAAADVGASVRHVTELLVDVPPHLETMAVSKLLGACRGFGPIRTRRTLTLLRISPTRTLAGLCADERVALVIELDQVVRRWEAQRNQPHRRRHLAETSGAAR